MAKPNFTISVILSLFVSLFFIPANNVPHITKAILFGFSLFFFLYLLVGLSLGRLSSLILLLLLLFFLGFGSESGEIYFKFQMTEMLFYLFIIALCCCFFYSERNIHLYFKAEYVHFCVLFLMFFVLWGGAILEGSGSVFREYGGAQKLAGPLGASPSAMVIGVLSSYIIYMSLVKRISTVIGLIGYILCLCFVYYSGSRITMLSLFLALVILVVFLAFDRIFWVLLLLGIVVSIGGVVYADAILNFISSVNTNGRLFIWLEILDGEYVSLWGNGYGYSISLLHLIGTGFGIQPHNDFIRLLLSHGVIGMFLFCVIGIVLIRRLMSLPKNEKIFSIQLLVQFAVFMLTDNVLIYPFVYVLVFVPVVSRYYLACGLNSNSNGKDLKSLFRL